MKTSRSCIRTWYDLEVGETFPAKNKWFIWCWNSICVNGQEFGRRTSKVIHVKSLSSSQCTGLQFCLNLWPLDSVSSPLTNLIVSQRLYSPSVRNVEQQVDPKAAKETGRMLFRLSSNSKQRQLECEGHNDRSGRRNSIIWTDQCIRDNDVGDQVTQEQSLILK